MSNPETQVSSAVAVQAQQLDSEAQGLDLTPTEDAAVAEKNAIEQAAAEERARLQQERNDALIAADASLNLEDESFVEEFETEVALDDDVDTLRTASLSEIFAQSDLNSFKIVPRLMVTLTPKLLDTLPDVVSVRSRHYSLTSPLRKGDGSVANPDGLLRSALADVASYAGELSAKSNLTFFGDVSQLDSAVGNLTDSISARLETILLAFNNGADEFDIPASSLKGAAKSNSDEGLDVANGAGESVGVLVNYLFSYDCWASVITPGIIDLNIVVNAVVPILVDANNPANILGQIHRILKNYANAAGISSDNYRTGLVLSVDDLVDPTTLRLMQYVTDPANSGTVDAQLVASSYLYGVADGEPDTRGLYSVGASIDDALATLFPYGGDALLLVRDFLKEETAVKAAGTVVAKKAIESSVDAPKKKKKKLKSKLSRA